MTIQEVQDLEDAKSNLENQVKDGTSDMKIAALVTYGAALKELATICDVAGMRLDNKPKEKMKDYQKEHFETALYKCKEASVALKQALTETTQHSYVSGVTGATRSFKSAIRQRYTSRNTFDAKFKKDTLDLIDKTKSESNFDKNSVEGNAEILSNLEGAAEQERTSTLSSDGAAPSPGNDGPT